MTEREIIIAAAEVMMSCCQSGWVLGVISSLLQCWVCSCYCREVKTAFFHSCLCLTESTLKIFLC